MRKIFGAVILLALATTQAVAADFDKHDKTALYDFRLRAPQTGFPENDRRRTGCAEFDRASEHRRDDGRIARRRAVRARRR